VQHYDAGAPAQYFATAYSGSSSQITIDAIRNPLTSPIRNSFQLNVPSFGQPPDASQLGTSNLIDTIDFRIKNGVYRNGRLYLCHTIGQGGAARVRWYEVALNGWPTSGNNPALLQSVTLDLGSAQHSFASDISVAADGTIALAFNRSSPNDYPYIARTFQRPGDIVNFRPPIEEQRSTAPETGSRWGDYGGIHEDPVAPGVFWNSQEYTNNGSWRTWIGQFDPNRLSWIQEPLHRGQPTTASVHGANWNDTVYFLLSLTGQGAGPCFLGTCLEITNPFQLAAVNAGFDGVASLTFTVPSSVPFGTAVWGQALRFVTSPPAMITSNVVFEVVQ